MLNASGMVSTNAARMRSAAIIVRRRSQRSASAPAHGPKITFGTAMAAIVKPTFSGVPRVATRKPSATWWIRSPIRLTSWPHHSRA